VLPKTKGSSPRDNFAKCDVRIPPQSGEMATILTVTLEGATDADEDCAEIERDGLPNATFIKPTELPGVGDHACGYYRTSPLPVVTVIARRGDDDVSVTYFSSTSDTPPTRATVVDFTTVVLKAL
jgi:hypothetical protein